MSDETDKDNPVLESDPNKVSGSDTSKGGNIGVSLKAGVPIQSQGASLC